MICEQYWVITRYSPELKTYHFNKFLLGNIFFVTCLNSCAQIISVPPEQHLYTILLNCQDNAVRRHVGRDLM